ncbi:MAG: hypothetical protein WCP52_04500 [Bacteroidota bacterium]
MELYDIFKNGEFKGNARGESAQEAIKKYLIASFYFSHMKDKKFVAQYTAKIAPKDRKIT